MRYRGNLEIQVSQWLIALVFAYKESQVWLKRPEPWYKDVKGCRELFSLSLFMLFAGKTLLLLLLQQIFGQWLIIMKMCIFAESYPQGCCRFNRCCTVYRGHTLQAFLSTNNTNFEKSQLWPVCFLQASLNLWMCQKRAYQDRKQMKPES